MIRTKQKSRYCLLALLTLLAVSCQKEEIVSTKDTLPWTINQHMDAENLYYEYGFKNWLLLSVDELKAYLSLPETREQDPYLVRPYFHLNESKIRSFYISLRYNNLYSDG